MGGVFGNPSALTWTLIERRRTAADLSDKNNGKLKRLADLYADVDCQMTHLPGLAWLK